MTDRNQRVGAAQGCVSCLALLFILGSVVLAVLILVAIAASWGG